MRGLQLLQKGIGERALADARLAGDEHYLTSAQAGMIERARKLLEFGGPTDQL